MTINVIDEDDKPAFGAADSTSTPPANFMRAMVAENASGDALNIATYTATDQDGEIVSLSLIGDDANLFELAADTDETNGVNRVLSFKKSPDFEMPGDRNDDNLYEVTVRASDGTMSADRMVVVKVTNVAEGGKVALSPEAAVPGVELTAVLMDPEGGVSASGQITGERWTWHNGVANEDFEAATGNAIPGETSPTYTPVADDLGDYLRAMVTYTYQGGAEKTGVSDAVLVQTSHDNQAPSFKEGASTFRVVAENVMAADDAASDAASDNIGSPVEATDANGDTVAYTLGGADAALFMIRSNGQLEVKGELDHEMDSSHRVTVTANDGSGGSNATDSITVTIYVTDADEAPKISVGPPSGLAISGPGSRRYAENGRGAVATYTAIGPDAANARWSLAGNDAGDFRISTTGGELTFRTSPDYEAAADANQDNVYMVTVTANDGTNTATEEVTVTVTNEEETGEVTLWAGTDALTMAPQVGDTITGAVMDPDGNPGDMPPIAMDTTINDVTWQWSRTMDTANMSSWMPITGATDAAYMVTADDVGYYLRVMATYTDAAGTDMGYSPATMMTIAAEEPQTLLQQYDANDNGEIDLEEVYRAIDDYFDYDDRITLAEVYQVVDLYFES